MGIIPESRGFYLFGFETRAVRWLRREGIRLGLGIDRLVMLFTGAGIRETILFPLLKPEGH